jgi:hypothetical protein
LDVATTHLPHLKGAVRATNIAYAQRAREQVAKDELEKDDRRVDLMKVEKVAKALLFE